MTLSKSGPVCAGSPHCTAYVTNSPHCTWGLHMQVMKTTHAPLLYYKIHITYLVACMVALVATYIPGLFHEKLDSDGA